MRTGLRNVVLAALLAMLPFQGIAATLTLLLCQGDAKVHAVHAASQSHHHVGDHGTGHAHGESTSQQDDSNNGGTPLYHLCCNLSASAPPSMEIHAALPDFSIRTFVPDTLPSLFVPEQPQRPPLA